MKKNFKELMVTYLKNFKKCKNDKYDLKEYIVFCLNNYKKTEKHKDNEVYIDNFIEKVNNTDIDIILVSFILSTIDKKIDLEELFGHAINEDN